MASDIDTTMARARHPALLFQLALVNRALTDSLERQRHPVAPHELLANIGHELRTPLTVIQGLSEILLDEAEGYDLPPEQERDFLFQIHRASLALGKLVETSIMLTRIDTGQLELQLQALQLREAMERVLAQYEEELDARRLKVAGEVMAGLPPVWADGFCLELCLQALIDNAIKFNVQEGQLHWRAWQQGTQVHLSVTDSGVGIAPEQLHGLYQVFGQIDSSPTRRFGGLGLGLPLVRKIMVSLGGDIRADSPGVNHGATFTCSFRAVLCYPEGTPERT